MARRKRNSRPSVRVQDGIQNLAQGVIGKRMDNARYTPDWSLTDRPDELETLWGQHWVVQKICSKKSDDMTRKWRKINSNDLSAEDMSEIESIEREIKLQSTLNDALKWASLYGGVGLLVITNANIATPLTAGQQIQRLVIIKPSIVAGDGDVNDNVISPNFGRYDYYVINSTLKVHHSRLIIINAVDRPLMTKNKLFGLSDIEPVYSVLKRFDTVSANIGELVTESKVDVFKMANLANALSSGREADIAAAMYNVQAIKSSTNSLLLDKDNEYEQKELTFTGLRDILIEFRNAVAGAADMPVTILFGQSAAGFASGQEDIDNYHEAIHALQEARLRPVFEALDPIIVGMAGLEMPEDWWFEFNSLSEMKTEQKVNALNIFASATNLLIQNGVLSEHQVASELKESGLFSKITDEDLELLEQESEEDDNGTGFEPSYQEPEDQTSEKVQVPQGQPSDGAVV